MHRRAHHLIHHFLNQWKKCSRNSFNIGRNLKDLNWSLSSQIIKRILRKVTFFLSCKLETSSTTVDLLDPPSHVKGMKVLDRAAFRKEVQCPILELKYIPFLILKDSLFKYELNHLKHFRSVTISKGGECRIVKMNPNVIKSFSDFDSDIQETFKELGVNSENFSLITITLEYKNWNYHSIFKAVLPQRFSFRQAGHIVQLNLKPPLLEYKYLIAEVVKDKFRNVKTVVNKIDSVENIYRTLNMEVLCGSEDMVVEVKENSCFFKFDFSKVFWNPRLEKTHIYLVNCLQCQDVLFDVTCGVGPFSIPAAKKKCKVFANDLNPQSVEWLHYNIKRNKVPKHYIQTYNKDGIDFIKEDIKRELFNIWKNKDEKNICNKIHVVINLPATSLKFLKYFQGLFSKGDVNDITLNDIKDFLPTVHVYFFVDGEKELACEEFEQNSGLKFDEKKSSITKIVNATPKRNMFKIAYEVPLNYLISDLDESVDLQHSIVDDEKPS